MLTALIAGRSVSAPSARATATSPRPRPAPRSGRLGSVRRDGPPHLHRAPAGRHLRPAPRRGPLAEELGFDAFFRSDHYLKMGDVVGLPGPDRRVDHPGRPRPETTTHPARHAGHRRPRSACPGRWPSAVANVDAMSGGRVELGLGAGWYDDEHAAYGIPFPPLGRALRPPRGAARDHHRAVGARRRARRSPSTGAHYQLGRTPPRCPSRCSRRGRRSSSAAAGRSARPRLAARYADEFNHPFPGPGNVAPVRSGIVAGVREAAGRDPGTLRVLRRARRLRRRGQDGGEAPAATIGRRPADVRTYGVGGTVEQAAEKLVELEAEGSPA